MTESRECLLAGYDDDTDGTVGVSHRTRGLGGPHHTAAQSGKISAPVDILRNKKDNGCRDMPGPTLRQSTLTRDPFPELSNSPLTSGASVATTTITAAAAGTQHIFMDTSARSTPSSSPPRNADQGYRSQPVSRSGSAYEIFNNSKSLSVYDLQGSRALSTPKGQTNDKFLNESKQELYKNNDNSDIQSGWTPSFYNKQLLFFYTDDENYKSLFVDCTMQASDICQCLVHKIHARYDINWVLVEHNTVLNIERLIEDHECIHSLHKQWQEPEDVRIYFRKDFRKFEPFRNPSNFIKEDMVDRTQLQDSDVSDLLPVTERYNHILLEHLFNIDRLPDVLGYCHLKDHKRSWKKVYLVLKNNDLYLSTKGTSRDPKHLSMTCSLQDVDIYIVNEAKKMYGAPYTHCICLKSPSTDDPKEIVFVGVEDEASLLCWYTALRLVKYKSQLKENYKLAVNFLERNALREREVLKSSECDSVDERVAMDFTGTRGRVVEDPSEAFGVACEEANRWRKKVTGRKVTSCQPSDIDTECRPSFLSNASVIPQQYTQGLGAGVHMVQPWYHSGISRQQAVDLIMKHGLVDGVFLLRESQSIPGIHVLSLAHNHKVKHCQIHKVESDGQKFYTLDGGITKFTDLIQLVEFYQLNAAGLPTRLTHYVTCIT